VVRHTDSQRFHEVDLLKAVGILAVVLIHSLRSPWESSVSSTELWLGHVTRFAVPGFLVASGYLYATTGPIGWELTRRRLTRIGVPYLFASAAVQIYRFLLDKGTETSSLMGDIFLFASFGPYYFVFILALFVLSSPMLAKLNSHQLIGVLALLLLVQLLLETGIIPPKSLFWHLRNPFVWAGYFVLGWWARLHRDRIVDVVLARRSLCIALFVMAFAIFTGATALPLTRGATGALAWLAILAAIGLVFSTTAGAASLPSFFRRASDASYPIYLYHLFFVETAKRSIQIEPRRFEPEKLLFIWACGLLGSLIVISVGRALLGRRSRTFLGA
jgi:surface polysaccharide O-acyltransferase-like enzyme